MLVDFLVASERTRAREGFSRMMGHSEEESKLKKKKKKKKKKKERGSLSGDKQTKIFVHLHLYSPYIRFNYSELIRSVFHRNYMDKPDCEISGWCIIIVIIIVAFKRT